MYNPTTSPFKLHGYNKETNRFSFDYNLETYTFKCDVSSATLKSFKTLDNKPVARTYKAMKKALNIKDESRLANEFRQMAMFASNYLKNIA